MHRVGEEARGNSWGEVAFLPRFEGTPGMGMYYEDGRVTGAVDCWEADGIKGVTISEWSCELRGNGYSVEALMWLRSQGFNRIVANGVGSLDLVEDRLVGDVATYYWAHMLRKGLVDVLLDDSGIELSVDAVTGALTFKQV